MVDVGILQKKTAKVVHCLQRLNPYLEISEETFLHSQDAIDISAHNLYVALQQLIGMGAHIVADDHLGDMAFMSDIPGILARERILEEPLAESFRKMIGFRNLLAHEYGDMDIVMMHRVIKEHLIDVHQVLEALLRYARMM